MIKKFKQLIRFAKPFYHVLSSKVTGKMIPLRLDMNVTKNCNLRCNYCYIDFEGLKSKEDLTVDQWKEILSDMRKRGTCSVRVMGGEPLIRNDIGEILEHCVRLGMMTEINSNGFFVKKRIEELKLVDSICLSLDGTKEANDSLRGKGCYDKVIEAIELCQANNIKVRLHGMMTNSTLDSLDHLATLSKKYNISFTCAPCCLSDMLGKNRSLYVERAQAVEFYKKYLALKNKGARILNSRPAINQVINWPLPEKIIFNEDDKWPEGALPYVRCQYGRKSCYIDADGMVYACSFQWGKGLNYFEHGFDKCWEYLHKELKCVTCNSINDFSYAFNLHPSIIKEIIKDIMQ